MGIRQDWNFDLGRITRFLEEYRSSADLKSCQSCAAERQSIESQCVGAFCGISLLWHDACGRKFRNQSEDFMRNGVGAGDSPVSLHADNNIRVWFL